MPSASSTNTAARLEGRLSSNASSRGLAATIGHPQVRAALLVALAYYAGAKIGAALTLATTSVSTLWPPDAILLAGLVLTPVRSWAAVCAAALAAHLAVQLEAGIPPAMILARFLSSSTGALVGAVAFRRLHTGEPRLDPRRETVLLLVCAGFVAPFVSFFLDTALVALNGWGRVEYWTNWQTRFFSSVLSAITIVPLIVTTARNLHRLRQARGKRWIEAAAIFALLLAASWFAFLRASPAPASFPVLVCVTFLVLVAAAVRLGSWGAGASFMTCALIAAWGTVQGLGPFAAGSPGENALGIELFLLIAWVPVMTLATLTED